MRSHKEVLKYITDIGVSLRLHMDIDSLLKRVANATCEALRFRHCVLYLFDNGGQFCVRASSGISPAEETYLHRHPVPDSILTLLTNDDYRISDSYFIPGESPLWQDETLASFFVVVDDEAKEQAVTHPVFSDFVDFHEAWRSTDLMIIPLRRADDTFLGFLTPDAPLDGLRPSSEMMELLELFANQAAVVIEGARLYDVAQQSSEERAALIEIGRVLFAPDALHDLHSVYHTIYEQVKRVMPTDAFFVSRYNQASDELIMDYLIDEEAEYPPEKYGFVPPWLRKLLLKELPGYLFSTNQAYEDFIRANYGGDPGILMRNRHPSQSLLFVPIYYGEEAIGLLSVQSYKQNAYTARHAEMFYEIAIQAGIAITNARLYTDLRDAVQKAQESERHKNQFLMTASHELRTPLTAIQGYLELLSAHGTLLDEKKKQRFLVNAQRACDELILLLGNVMDTSRIDQEWISLKLDAVCVHDGVRQIMEIFEPLIGREKRPVEICIAPDLRVWVDDLRLRQILLNIVGNALKYTPATAKIAITAEQKTKYALFQDTPLTPRSTDSEHFVVIAVRDWGPGITLEDQQRLFAKFMRIPSTSQGQRGTGWGLYLCRKLVETMKGYIWIESKGVPGEGSTFYMAFPRAEIAEDR